MDIYDFGIRLKQLREKKGLSQAEVAERIHVAKGTVSRYERNVQNPKLDVLVKMAVFYNTSIDYILGFANRANIYIDDLPEDDRDIVAKTIDTLKAELSKRRNG